MTVWQVVQAQDVRQIVLVHPIDGHRRLESLSLLRTVGWASIRAL